MGMDKDGVKGGCDIPLTQTINERAHLPVIASGRCGTQEHILDVFQKTKTGAALAASIFHYETYSIKEIKEYLRKSGIAVRS